MKLAACSAARIRSVALPVLLAVGILAGCSAGRGDPQVEFLTSPTVAGLPFSEAVRVGPMLILSGQIGVAEDGRLVPGGIEAETRRTMENIQRVLRRNGASMSDVVKCTAMLADVREWSSMNEVYVGYFPGDLPARSAFGANGLALGARIEMECWAYLPR